MFSPEIVLKTVPHRYPFLMIDRIIEHDYRKRAVCRKNVTFGEEVLVGHFPKRAIYPGVLLIEMGLQTTHVMLTEIETRACDPEREPEQGFAIQVEKFKFQSVVEPGDVLVITSDFVQELMGIIKAKITITTHDMKPVAEGTVVVGSGKGGA